jgi:hypothetical protein
VSYPTSTCRSCGAEIIWAETITGSRIPVDATMGATVFTLRPGAMSGMPPVFVAVKPYTSHFATCPNADEHRKKR